VAFILKLKYLLLPMQFKRDFAPGDLVRPGSLFSQRARTHSSHSCAWRWSLAAWFWCMCAMLGPKIAHRAGMPGAL